MTQTLLGRYLSASSPLYAGLTAGLLGLMLSIAVERILPGRFPGDPLPLVLSFSQILRGTLIYFNWRAPLLHLIFVSALALLAVGLFRYQRRSNGFDRHGAIWAARLATLINVGVAVVARLDAVRVALFYLFATYLSLLIVSLVAEQAARFWQGRPGDQA